MSHDWICVQLYAFINVFPFGVVLVFLSTFSTFLLAECEIPSRRTQKFTTFATCLVLNPIQS